MAPVGEFTARFPSRKASVAKARRAILVFVSRHGFLDLEAADVETAAGEALANAVEHGHTAGSEFSVRVRADAAGVTIEIEDSGRGFDPAVVRPQEKPEAPRGFGIAIMRRLMDRVEFNERGNVIRLVKYRRHAAGAQDGEEQRA